MWKWYETSPNSRQSFIELVKSNKKTSLRIGFVRTTFYFWLKNSLGTSDEIFLNVPSYCSFDSQFNHLADTKIIS